MSSSEHYTGGIVGQIGWYDDSSKNKGIIYNCVNKGTVTSTSSTTGGISGVVIYGSIVENAQNYGNISNTGKNTDNSAICGGIVGQLSVYGNNIVKNCINKGEIKAEYNRYGGIVGWAQNGHISNCKNEGRVVGSRAHIGGIAGSTGRYDDSFKKICEIENCINMGNIEILGTGASGHCAGGITGCIYYNSQINYCGNTGNVTTRGYVNSSNKSSYTGGICGGTASTSGNYLIKCCYNTGIVTGAYQGISGIIGRLSSSTAKIEYCYSTGKVIGNTGVAYIGGIVGHKQAGTVNNSYYLENTVQDTNGNKQAKETLIGDKKTQTEIKGITNLNVWKDYFKNDKTPNINNGYPILNWQ